jgi:hypothetical protein
MSIDIDGEDIDDAVTPPLKFIDDPVYEIESILKNSPTSPVIVPVASMVAVLRAVVATVVAVKVSA